MRLTLPPVAIGHRGARAWFPENTQAGFEATLALGVQRVEFDVLLTRDDVPVVHHNVHLNADIARDAQGRWLSGPPPAIRDLTLRQLQQYDLGRIRPDSALSRRFPDQRPIDGAHAPTLEAVCALPFDQMLIELKFAPRQPDLAASVPAAVDRVMQVLDRTGTRQRATILCFYWTVLRYLRDHYPDMRRGWSSEAETIADQAAWIGVPVRMEDLSVPRAIAAELGGNRDGAAAGEHWIADQSILTRNQVAEAHRLGIGVLAWTVNDPTDMARLTEWGVDGLISDCPDRVALPLNAKL